MMALHDNIKIMEQIEKDYGSLDEFVINDKPCNVAKMLSNGKYKMKQVGEALSYEYLRNVGIDEVKPDVHIKRIMYRLRFVKENAKEDDIISKLGIIAKETDLSKAYLDALLWTFCAIDYGNICSKNPKCQICKLNGFCQL